MLFTSNRSSDVIVYNSITNTLVEEKFDNNQPFAFIEFLNYTKSLTNNTIDFVDYQAYLKKWNAVTTVKYDDLNEVVRQEFISFLKTITVNYTTAEERRYLSNLNFQSKEDLEIAAPFFSTKIKQVLLYFASKRDTYSINFELSKNKGSVFGVTNYLKTTIVETIFGDNLTPSLVSSQPLSTIASNLQIEVEEGYDTYNNYFDLDPYEPPSFYYATGERDKYFTSNTNVINKEIFLDYDKAIIDLINSEEVVLSTLQSLVVNINTPNLNLLQDYDFIDYGNRTRENLKLILNAELVRKFTGTNFYYLSTGSDGNSLSGLLFEASSPFGSLLNVNNPTTLTVPESSVKYERDVGLFFKPTHQSILQLQTPFTYVKKDDLKKNFVYIFPDPDDYGNITGVSKTDHETPLQFIQDGKKIQKNISSNNALGNSFVTKNDFTFESYHSKEQNSVKNVSNQLYNAGVVSNNLSDIYGNLYIGFKQQNSDYLKNFANNVTNNIAAYGLSAFTNVTYLSSIQKLKTNGTFEYTQSTTTNEINNLPRSSIYNQRNSIGNFFVYNIFSNTLNPLSSEFNTVFEKYPSQQSELQNKLFSINIYNDTFVFTTSSFVVIDKINYIDGEFTKSYYIPFTLETTINNKASNEFLIGDNLYIAKCFITPAPLTSAYNSRFYTLQLYTYNLTTKKFNTLTFSDNSNVFFYNTGTLLNVTDIKLIYNKKQDLFDTVITFKDLNNNLFINNRFIKMVDSQLVTLKETMFTPGNINNTINFYDSSFTSFLQLNALDSSPAPTIDTTNGTLIF